MLGSHRNRPAERALCALVATSEGRAAGWADTALEVGLELVALTRSDLWPEHWHKSRSPEVGAQWRAALATRHTDVAVVDGWSGTSDDLVRIAARAGVPSVLLLDGHEATCALGSRLRSSDGAACDAVEGLHPCLACAAAGPPRASWVPADQQPLRWMKRRMALDAEFAAARVVGARSAPHAQDLRGRGVAPPGGLHVLDSADAWRAALHAALGAGAPSVPAEGWFEARMAAEELSAWDAGARGAGPEGA